MPTPAYMKIKGKNQGEMSSGAMSADSVGTMSKSSFEDYIQVQAFKHQIMVPTDPQSGQPSGVRTHRGMSITKVYDKASPLLYQMLATGEQIEELTIEWYRTSASGEQEHYFTTKIEEGTIVDITAHMPNCLDPANGPFTHMEDITISYKKIEWTHEAAGTSGSDSWDG